MRPSLLLGLLLGLALLAVVVWTFRGDLVTLALAGTALPVAGAAAYRVVSLALHARSWHALLLPEKRPRFARILRMRWIGEAVNGVLPVAQVGGDLARARLLARSGVPGAEAGAAMVGDFATGVATQIVFVILGLAALAARGEHGSNDIVRPAAVGLVLLVVLVIGLWDVLRLGARRIAARLRRWPPIVKPLGPGGFAAGGAKRLEAALHDLLGRRRALVKAFVWHLVGWLSQVGETLLVLSFAGAAISFPAALAVESLSGSARALAFFVPGGLGVQEGAVVLLCRQVGVPAEAALMLGLVKRLRELVVGFPGLVAWGIAERHTPAALRARWRRRREDRAQQAQPTPDARPAGADEDDVPIKGNHDA
jgi:putative membrane protein